MRTKPWKDDSFTRENPNHAASHVNWEDAIEFCRRLSTMEGQTYRLPSEAEWEYACRAGTTTIYSFGDDYRRLEDYAWYDKNAYDVDEKYAHRVGVKLPNAWGLYDMHGNVFEWCADWYSLDYYGKSPRENPVGPTSGYSRVFRGGAFGSPPGDCRSAVRRGYPPTSRNVGIGFRVVRELE